MGRFVWPLKFDLFLHFVIYSPALSLFLSLETNILTGFSHVEDGQRENRRWLCRADWKDLEEEVNKRKWNVETKEFEGRSA